MKISQATANVTTANASISKTNTKRSSGSAERDVALDDVVITTTKDKPSQKLTETSTNGQAYPEVEIDTPTVGAGDGNNRFTVQENNVSGDSGKSSGNSNNDGDRDDDNRTSSVIDKIA